MAVSEAVKVATQVIGFYSNYSSDCYVNRCNNTNVNEDSIFSRSLVVNVEPEGRFFIPTFIAREFQLEHIKLLDGRSMPDAGISFIKPLRIGGEFTGSFNSGQVITRLLKLREGYNIAKIKSGDNSYLGGRGLLLREDYTPIMMYGYNVDIVNTIATFVEPVVYLHPSIFTEKDNLSKYICKNVVPLLLNYKFLPMYYYIFGSTTRYRNISVREGYSTIRLLIEDFSHMIYKVPSPKDINFSKDIQEKLIESLNDS